MNKDMTPEGYYKQLVRLSLFVKAEYHYLAVGSYGLTLEELKNVSRQFFDLGDKSLFSEDHRKVLDSLGDARTGGKFQVALENRISMDTFDKLDHFMRSFNANYDRDSERYLENQRDFRADMVRASNFVAYQRDIMTRLFGDTPRSEHKRGVARNYTANDFKYFANVNGIELSFQWDKTTFEEPTQDLIEWMVQATQA